jgi:histidyl-tRNA synthetase
MKLANAARSRIVLFVGGEEAAQNSCKVKELCNGNEEIVALDSLCAHLRKLLNVTIDN